MFCTNCSKLAFLYTKRSCIRCQAEILNNLSVLCEKCSESEKVCSVCLKKVQNSQTDKYKFSGCVPCKAKQR